MNDNYTYHVTVSWLEDRKGIVESTALDDKIVVATPPEFAKGMARIWSPEHLFAAAVSSCFMTTFLAIAEKSRLEFTSFECPASAVLEKNDRQFMITSVVLKPVVTIAAENEVDKALKVLQLSNQACLISHSIKSDIVFMPCVTVAQKAEVNP